MRYLFTACSLLLLHVSMVQAQVSLDINYGLPFQLNEFNDFSFQETSGSSWTGNAKYIKKTLGFGLQYNRSSYLPGKSRIENLQLIPEASTASTFDQWSFNLYAAGPVIRLGKERFYFELFPKFGYMDVNSANYQVVLQDAGEEILLYQENRDAQTDNGLFYGLDGSLYFGLSDQVGLQLFAGYNTNSGFGNGSSTIYRELDDLGPNTSIEEVKSSRLLQEDCSVYNLLTTGIGIKITFGGKPKNTPAPKRTLDKMLPPVSMYPENGAAIAAEERESLQLEWQSEQPEVRQANYRVLLYQVTSEGQDSLIYEGKSRQKLALELPTEVELKEGMTYRWQVQAIEDKRLAPCPDGCYSTLFEFVVGGLGPPAFYQLLDKNNGNAIPSGGILRFVVDEDLMYTDQLSLQLFDERSAPVLEKVNLLEDSRVKRVSTNRFEMSIGQLQVGKEYTIRVNNGNRSQFLRFYRAGAKRSQNEK